MNKHLKFSSNGFMLALVMIFMVILFILGAAISALSFPEFFFINRHAGLTSSLNVAEAGIVEAIYRIEQFGNYNGFSGIIDASYPPNSGTYGSYNVTITSDPGNPSDTFQIYRVRSVSSLNANPTYHRTIEAIIQSTSFCRFVYFTHQETMRGTGTLIWFKMGETLDGPVHSNDNIRINWNGYASNPPIFLDKVTTAQNLYFDPRTPTGNQWKEVFRSGTAGFETQVGLVNFPPLTDLQKTAALGGITEPTTEGIYLPNDGTSVTGGVYIRGDTKKIQCSVNVSGNQQLLLTRTVSGVDRTETITMDRPNNTTAYTDYEGTTTYYNKIINGAVYVRGNINDFRGTVKDRLTFFTPQGNTTTINTHVQYSQNPQTNPNFDGALGIVSGDIKISSSAPSNLIIQAAMLTANTAGDGSFYNDGYSSGSPKGNLNILGSLCQQRRGPVGQFDSYSGQLIHGYNKNYHYDTRLAYRPPPYFPCTGKFRVAFWRIIQ